jgi:hypothetical protein
MPHGIIVESSQSVDVPDRLGTGLVAHGAANEVPLLPFRHADGHRGFVYREEYPMLV